METNRLEEFIKANREEFDQMEPSEKVWDSISKNSGKHKVLRLNRALLRVAAILVFVVISSALLLKSNILSLSKQINVNQIPGSSIYHNIYRAESGGILSVMHNHYP